MSILRTWMVALLPLLASSAMAQAWVRSYDAGLQAARQGKWTEARQSFRQAAADRPDDMSGPTLLPGPPTEQRRWREGAPYSPNFLAAYSEYRSAIAQKDPVEQTDELKTAATEFETLLAKGQRSRETVFFLNLIYTRLDDQAKRQALAKRVEESNGRLGFKVDDEIVAPEELAAMQVPEGGTQTVTIPTAPGKEAPTVKAGVNTTGYAGGNVNPITPGLGLGTVPAIANKYALIIGQSRSAFPEGSLPFGDTDATRVRDAVVTYAGYSPSQVRLVQDATATQIMEAARDLASLVPEDGAVLIYFAGGGVNIEGKDYLAGTDATSASDTAAMVAKSSLYRMFGDRGAHVFAFYEANRTLVNGGIFGSEMPSTGSVAQMMATLPSDSLETAIHNGQRVGLFAEAFCAVLKQLRSNRIPISEFGWQVFDKLRKGDSGYFGGGSLQTPTLPTLRGLAIDARF